MPARCRPLSRLGVIVIEALEAAIEKVTRLSEERQRYVAQVLEQIVGAGDDLYRLSDEERRLVREGLADLDAGRIVSDADMDAFWRRRRP